MERPGPPVSSSRSRSSCRVYSPDRSWCSGFERGWADYRERISSGSPDRSRPRKYGTPSSTGSFAPRLRPQRMAVGKSLAASPYADPELRPMLREISPPNRLPDRIKRRIDVAGTIVISKPACDSSFRRLSIGLLPVCRPDRERGSRPTAIPNDIAPFESPVTAPKNARAPASSSSPARDTNTSHEIPRWPRTNSRSSRSPNT